MSIYTLSLYVPGSKVPTKWLYTSLEEAFELPRHWEDNKNSDKLDWSIFSDGEVVYEMLHNPKTLPEDLFD